MHVSIILSLIVAVCLFGSSNASLRCYMCTSAQEGCSEHSVDGKYASDCPAHDDFGHTVQYCSKLIIAEQNVTMRGCESGCRAPYVCDSRSYGCQQEAIEHINKMQTSCRCTGNLCNTGHSLRTAVPLGAILLFTAFLRKLV